MSRGGSVAACLVVVLVSALLLTAVAPGAGAHEPAFAGVSQIDADRVQLDVALRPDGSAQWAIRYRVLLADENETAAFESLEQDVRENRSAFTDRFAARIQGTVSAAENATSREMAVRNVSVRTTRQEIPQRYGVLIYSFEWRGFARTDETTIRAGDAIGGLYLDRATSLTIRWPSDYGSTTVDPAPDESGDRSATWRGPAEFTTEQPRLVLSNTQPTESGPGTGDATGGVNVWAAATATLLGLAVLFTGGWWWRRRQPDDSGTVAVSAGPDPSEELLSNEERVLRLLAEHGGRLKQQQVVEELGWTDAKTSQVVGDLRESGEVEGFRLGRENVLRLPEEDDGPDS